MTSLRFPENADCLAKKHLTPFLKQTLGPLKTPSGFTLAQAIASGIKNPDSDIGLYAGDAQSYDVFSPLFDAIINEYHNISKDQIHQSDLSLPDLPCLDPDGRYILSTRIRAARNIKGFNFCCHMDLPQRRNIEKKIVSFLDKPDSPLTGMYVSFENSDLSLPDLLEDKTLLFKKGDRFQDAAGFNTDFPKSRGVFYSSDRQLRIWVNEEDHLRIISQEKSADLYHVFQRLIRVMNILEDRFDFVRDRKYGYLTSCPTNIGTSMRAGVHIRLEKLEKNSPVLDRIAQKHDLQIRGTGGEKTKVDHAIFDISNRQRLGITESMIVQKLHAGIHDLIQAEKQL